MIVYAGNKIQSFEKDNSNLGSKIMVIMVTDHGPFWIKAIEKFFKFPQERCQTVCAPFKMVSFLVFSGMN